MTQTKSQKILPWTTRNYVLNVLTYVINTLVIAALLVLAVYFNGQTGEADLGEYLESLATPIHFLILLILTVAIMALYFIFEDKNFLRNATNSEMLFLIIELALIVCFVSGKYANISEFVAFLKKFLSSKIK